MSTALAEPTPAELAKDNVSLNDLEHFLASCPKPPDCHVENRFTPGLYSRTIYMPAGMLCTSKIHKTEHQFVVSSGHCKVWAEDQGWVDIRAGFIGVTKPGTRRALWMIEDTVWTTFHPTRLTYLREIESELMEPHDIPK